jgi:hypothetical protein
LQPGYERSPSDIEDLVSERPHEFGIISASVIEGNAPVRMIRFSTDPEDGWWILAESDVPIPDTENARFVCIHCVVEALDASVAAGLDLARSDAMDNPVGVGVAAWDRGRWLSGEAAVEVLEDAE